MKPRMWLRRNLQAAAIIAVALTSVVAPVVGVGNSTDVASAGGEIEAKEAIAEARPVATAGETEAAEGAPTETTSDEAGPAPSDPAEVSDPPASPVSDVDQFLQEQQADDGLLSPEAAVEREESQFAFANVSPEESEGLLLDQFSSQLDQIDADPSRALSDVTIEQVTSPTEVLGTVEGEPVLIESTVPMRTFGDEGLTKVDLGLEETEGAFEPRNALAETVLPSEATGQIQVGQIGLSLQRGNASPARLLTDEDLYFPGAAEDTSLLLSPTSGGVEMSAMILSRESPEMLDFSVSMPPGAHLRSAPDGGAEVVNDGTGEPLGRIGAPFAVDAQGIALPMDLTVEKGGITLELHHRAMDIAYPIFIDPEIEEHWEGFTDTSKLNYWQWEWTGVPNSETYIGRRSCIVTCWGNGLYVRGRSGTTYPAGSYGRWKFVPQGSTTYMRRVVLGPMNYDAHGCSANEPHPYVGVYTDAGTWAVRSNAYPSGWANSIDSNVGGNLPPGSRAAIVGIHADAAANIGCGRDYRLGGVALYLTDPENPTVGTVTGYPTNWVKDNSPFTVKVPVSDPGLGVKSAAVSPKDSPPLATQTLVCSGHYDSQCPASNTFQFNVTADSFDQGEKEVRVSATDAMTKFSNTVAFMLKVDRTPPSVTLGGQLAVATKESEGDAKDPTAFDQLGLPVYNLSIQAEDGVENGSASQRRSGVGAIEVFLDKESTPRQVWTNRPCSNSCGMTKTFTLKLNELSSLTHHTLRVVVRDQAGNTPREREIGFEYVPATGEKDGYAMQRFPLFDTEAEPEEGVEASGPELAVNLMNGNLVFHQEDVDVPGPAADLEVERYYNSLLPASQDTEWGDGWTLAQTPELEVEKAEAGPTAEATVLEESGAVESQVALPAKAGEERFDPVLQAMIAKEPGGYSLTDETGESAGSVKFTEGGQADELETGEFSGVEYDYEEGEIAEIAVDDVASTDLSPEKAAELEELANPPVYASSLGTQGTGPGQFEYAQALARDPEGNLWVGDLDTNKGTNRIQKFDSDGNFLDQVIAPGGGAEGRLYVSGMDTDAEGNLWITDWAHARVEAFDKDGNFIRRFGSQGSGSGQFDLPEGIAIDANGHVWVADKRNGRLQEFTATGQFVKVVGAGELGSPNSITAAPDGRIWVTEFTSDEVSVFEPDGTFVRSFGEGGSGEGQFDQPGGIAIDGYGHVWVGDQRNDRVQEFTEGGDFIRELGEEGTGPGQFRLCYTIGLVSDGRGGIWVTDYANHRVQRMRVTQAHASPVSEVQDDPAVAVETSGGLVETVEGEEAGEISYEHAGKLLTAVAGDDGETSYEYDAAGHMTRVTLPDGSWAEIAYEATYGRVKVVTVSIKGASSKTTNFSYEDQPQRRTTVTTIGTPVTTYEFAEDGSVLKWWNTAKPPTIDDVGGTLYDNRESSGPISPGLYNLTTQAFSAEGVASIQIVANGSTIVSERTCSQIPGPPIECEELKDEWVTETAAWPPGIVYLEVIATDTNGESTAERIWVNIPYSPPGDPEAEEPPTFNEILEFREDFGLDLDLKGDEEAINDRIFNLLGDWHNPTTPSGEVARATMGAWGVPLRLADAAEMEYREGYIAHAATAIPQWASEHGAGADYAGYFVDHRNGGVIHVGFTNAQGARVTALAQAGVLPAARLQPFPGTPTKSLSALEGLEAAVGAGISGISGIRINIDQNRLDVGAEAVAQVQAQVNEQFANQPINVYYKPQDRALKSSSYGSKFGPVRAAERLESHTPNAFTCSAGFGAWDRTSPKPDGTSLYRHFLLTAGHCFPLGDEIYQWNCPLKPEATCWEKQIGDVTRYAFDAHPSGFATDALAIKLDQPELAPRLIRWSADRDIRIAGVATPREGMVVCIAGAIRGRSKCGDIDWPPETSRWEVIRNNGNPKLTTVPIDINSKSGDSGGPIWERRTGYALGTLTGGNVNEKINESWFTPLRSLPGYPSAPGTFKALQDGANPLHIIKWK